MGLASPWHLLGPGIEPLPAALASGLLATGPPEKVHLFALDCH